MSTCLQLSRPKAAFNNHDHRDRNAHEEATHAEIAEQGTAEF